MIDYGQQRTEALWRQSIADLKRVNSDSERDASAAREAYETRCTDIVNALTGDYRARAKDLYRKRYAFVARPSTMDTVGAYERPRNYELANPQSIEITNDLHEIVPSGVVRIVAEKLGSLFSIPGGAWTYTVGDSEEPNEDIANAINAQRTAGLGWSALIRADRTSVACGVGFVRLHWSVGGIRYHSIPPQHVALVYGDEVRVGSADGAALAADLRDLEDASAIIVRETDADTDGRAIYAAWVGRSEADPNGRYLRYYASKDWQAIPQAGSGGIIYEAEEGNPFTVAQNKTSVDEVPYEYPFIALLGGYLDTLDTMPPDDLLWADLDSTIAISRCLKAAVINASGTRCLENDNNRTPPASLEGDIALADGQRVTVHSVPTSNARDALDVALSTVRHVLSSRGVPADEVRVDVATAPESGVSIMLRSAPLELARQQRAASNTTAVARLFEIERIMLNLYGDFKIPSDAVQTWAPGSFAPPVDRDALVTRLVTMVDKRLARRVDAIMELYGIDEASANKRLAQIDAESAATAPAPAANPISRFGLAPRASRKAPPVTE